MVKSIRPLAVALVAVALSIGSVGAQEPDRGSQPKPAPIVPPSKGNQELKGISCTRGIACPIISVPIPDVPLAPNKPAEPRPRG